jgi:hypothetical protein
MPISMANSVVDLDTLRQAAKTFTCRKLQRRRASYASVSNLYMEAEKCGALRVLEMSPSPRH